MTVLNSYTINRCARGCSSSPWLSQAVPRSPCEAHLNLVTLAGQELHNVATNEQIQRMTLDIIVQKSLEFLLNNKAGLETRAWQKNK